MLGLLPTHLTPFNFWVIFLFFLLFLKKQSKLNKLVRHQAFSFFKLGATCIFLSLIEAVKTQRFYKSI